ALAAGVDQVLGQGAEDAVAARVHLADLLLVLARGLDHAGRARVDDGGYPAGLRIESVGGFNGHLSSLRWNYKGKGKGKTWNTESTEKARAHGERQIHF